MRNLKIVREILMTKGSICEWEAIYKYAITPKELSRIIDLVQEEGFIMSKQRFFFDFEYDVVKINKKLK